eukprot:324160_1
MNNPYLLSGGAFALLSASSLYYLNKRLQLFKDIQTLMKMKNAKTKWEQVKSKKEWSIVDTFEEQVKKNGNKIGLILADNSSNETMLTFNDINNLSNIIAQWVINNNFITTNSCVALFMQNHPMFVVCLIGLAKVGVKVALLNNSIKLDGLLHCIDQVKCDHIIYSTELTESISDIQQELQKRNIGLSYFDNFKQKQHIKNSKHENLEQFVQLNKNNKSIISNEELKQYRKNINFNSIFCYVYTSGTTGLPKAAIIQHIKPLVLGIVLSNAFAVRPDDVIYGSGMPLYHTAGGLAGLGMHWFLGATFIVKKKFSVGEFWDDARKYKATCIQYIGEIVRYLCNVPKQNNDTTHSVRIAIGNGLRKDIWEIFQRRFNISEIGELYGSTEGTAFMYNFHQNGLLGNTRGIGACGDLGYLTRKILGFKIVKYDTINEEPLRDKDTGLLIEADYGEPGELLGAIEDVDAYRGYTNKEATLKKIIGNVFQKGDRYFRTGDLLKLESDGTIYFVDRIGDTFRWKGENCSTNEVEQILLKFDGIEEAHVYGIELIGHDGRAPMASVKFVNGIDFDQQSDRLYKYLKELLPSYAIPLFIRSCDELVTTGNFKVKKATYRNDGADPNKVTKKDKLYYLNGERYEILTVAKYNSLPRSKL